MLSVVELRNGLSVRSTSFVGRVELGSLAVTIVPKITGMRLLTLLRYAYGLRNLDLSSAVDYHAEDAGFVDLLLSQLAAEARELLSRGLCRRYVAVSESLALPKGRVDMQRLAIQGGVTRAALPCVHHPRQEDVLLNRVLLAGVCLGADLATEFGLKRRLRSLAGAIQESVAPVPLSRDLLARAERQLNRLTVAYEPALVLIKMLVASLGIGLEEGPSEVRLRGFLFDMNRFFEALISRFLHEYLSGYEVQDQYQLRDMMSYVDKYNPRDRRAPLPRPDYVIKKAAAVVAILDAKYVDLWEKDLGRDILYQLAIYAMSQKRGVNAVALYPSAAGPRPEARIELRDPVAGVDRAQVILRAVDLAQLEALVSQRKTAAVLRDASRLARELVFGKAATV
jgi:5-methylcytosine-specific restriction enzyme subunit McrC